MVMSVIVKFYHVYSNNLFVIHAKSTRINKALAVYGDRMKLTFNDLIVNFSHLLTSGLILFSIEMRTRVIGVGKSTLNQLFLML